MGGKRYGTLLVVSLAVVPDELDLRHRLVRGLVFPRLYLFLEGVTARITFTVDKSMGRLMIVG